MLVLDAKAVGESTVTRRYWGTLYYIRPDWRGDREDRSESVVETYRNGPSDIQVAIELWRLAGNDGGAHEIEEILESAYEGDELILNDAKLSALLSNLDRLELELQKSVVDREWRIPDEKLQALRAHARLVDLDEHPGVNSNDGVLEAMHRVIALRNILRDAQRRGLHVLLD